MVIEILAVFGSAFLASALLTPLIGRSALAIGLADHPDVHRKTHGGSIPLGGGLAVFLVAVAVLAVLTRFPGSLAAPLADQPTRWLWQLAAAAVIVVVGLADDRWGLRGRKKLAGQLLATLLLINGGLVIERIGLFGVHFELGIAAVPFTLFWLLGAINAINLLDGIDGLAGTVGVILAATMAGMAGLIGQQAVAVVALVFAASLLGFLVHNLPPARIFLGDAGSMLIGLVVGALALQSSLKGPGTILLAAPLTLLTIPIFDSTAAILRRKLAGRSIFAADRGHIHHRLFERSKSNRRVLTWIGGSCLVTSLAAVGSAALQSDLIALLTAAAVVLVFVVTGTFGRVELQLLSGHLRRFGRLLLPSGVANGRQAMESVLQIQGSHEWGPLWEALAHAAQRLELTRVRLDVNLPRLQESFNARWAGPSGCGDRECWSLDYPVIFVDMRIGQLTAAGCSQGATARRQIAEVLELFEPLEICLLELAESDPPVPGRRRPPAEPLVANQRPSSDGRPQPAPATTMLNKVDIGSGQPREPPPGPFRRRPK